jgi:hypothetical protein
MKYLLEDIFRILLIILFVLSSAGAIYFNQLPAIQFINLFILLSYVFFAKNKKPHISKNHAFFLYIIFVLFAVNLLSFDVIRTGDLMFLIIFCTALLFSTLVDSKKFCLDYTYAFSFLVLFSLITIYLYTYFGIGLFLFSFTNQSDLLFHSNIVSTVLDCGVGRAFCERNYGVFSEPGVYVGFIVFGFIGVSQISSKFIKIFILAILTIGLLSTESRLLYVFFPILVLLAFKKSYKIERSILLFSIVAIFITLLVGLGVGDTILNILSNLDRAAPLLYSSQKLGVDNIFYGKGLNFLTQASIDIGFFTSTWSALLLGYGVLFLCILFYFVSVSAYRSGHFLFFIIYIIAFSNSQGLVHNLLFWVLALLFVSDRVKLKARVVNA